MGFAVGVSGAHLFVASFASFVVACSSDPDLRRSDGSGGMGRGHGGHGATGMAGGGSGGTAAPGEGGTGGAGSGSGGVSTSAAGSGAGGVPTSSTATEPKEAVSCGDISGMAHTYGDDPVCRRLWMCQPGIGGGPHWTQLNPAAGPNCTPPVPSKCPEEKPENQALCPGAANTTCYYDPGIACLCQPAKAICSDADASTQDAATTDAAPQDAATREMISAWSCTPEPPCWYRVPPDGYPCTMDGLRCEYPIDFCAGPTPNWAVWVARCVSGKWSVTAP